MFAVPGHPLDPRAEGTNKLLKSGATLVTEPDDLLSALAPLTSAPPPHLREADVAPFAAEAASLRRRRRSPSATATASWPRSDRRPIDVDSLVRGTGLSHPRGAGRADRAGAGGAHRAPRQRARLARPGLNGCQRLASSLWMRASMRAAPRMAASVLYPALSAINLRS